MADWLDMVFEDDALVVVNKPAGLVCHPTKGGDDSSVVGRMRLTFGGGHEVHLLNRLDRETGGLLLMAKGREAAGELRRLFDRGSMEKEYRAIVRGWPVADEASMTGSIGMATNSVVAVRRAVCADGKPARTDYRVCRRFDREEGRFAEVQLFPRTGRTHQIRVHLEAAGHPIVGDKIYGGDGEDYLAFIRRGLSVERRRSLMLPFHALHAQRVRFDWRGRAWVFEVLPEPWFDRFLSGDPVDVDWRQCHA